MTPTKYSRWIRCITHNLIWSNQFNLASAVCVRFFCSFFLFTPLVYTEIVACNRAQKCRIQSQTANYVCITQTKVAAVFRGDVPSFTHTTASVVKCVCDDFCIVYPTLLLWTRDRLHVHIVWIVWLSAPNWYQLTKGEFAVVCELDYFQEGMCAMSQMIEGGGFHVHRQYGVTNVVAWEGSNCDSKQQINTIGNVIVRSIMAIKYTIAKVSYQFVRMTEREKT